MFDLRDFFNECQKINSISELRKFAEGYEKSLGIQVDFIGGLLNLSYHPDGRPLSLDDDREFLIAQTIIEGVKNRELIKN